MNKDIKKNREKYNTKAMLFTENDRAILAIAMRNLVEQLRKEKGEELKPAERILARLDKLT